MSPLCVVFFLNFLISQHLSDHDRSEDTNNTLEVTHHALDTPHHTYQVIKPEYDTKSKPTNIHTFLADYDIYDGFDTGLSLPPSNGLCESPLKARLAGCKAKSGLEKIVEGSIKHHIQNADYSRVYPTRIRNRDTQETHFWTATRGSLYSNRGELAETDLLPLGAVKVIMDSNDYHFTLLILFQSSVFAIQDPFLYRYNIHFDTGNRHGTPSFIYYQECQVMYWMAENELIVNLNLTDTMIFDNETGHGLVSDILTCGEVGRGPL